MRIFILAVGKLKPGPERELVERYLARCNTGGRALGLQRFEIREIPLARAGTMAQRKLKEAAAIVSALPDDGKLVGTKRLHDTQRVLSPTLLRHGLPAPESR